MASASNISNKSPMRSLYKQKKEGPSVVDGKVIVDIEVCQNCKDHQWCTRHDEAKYNKMFEEIQTAIISENPDVIVTKNNFVQVPTLGAFEITCMGALLYSKNRSGCFPLGSIISSLIKSFLQDKQNGKPTNHYDLKQIESNPNKEDAKFQTGTSFRKGNRSPQRPQSNSRGTRGRNSHYSGKGNCVESYQYVVSSTFGHGKRSPDARSQQNEKSMNSTVQSGFYETKQNQVQHFSENHSNKGDEERTHSKNSHHSDEKQQIQEGHDQQQLDEQQEQYQQHSNHQEQIQNNSNQHEENHHGENDRQDIHNHHDQDHNHHDQDHNLHQNNNLQGHHDQNEQDHDYNGQEDHENNEHNEHNEHNDHNQNENHIIHDHHQNVEHHHQHHNEQEVHS